MQPSRGRVPVIAAVLVATLTSQVLAGAVLGAGTAIVGADFSGGAGTALVGGTQFARSGAALTLTVVTDTAATCVSLAGAHTGSTNTPTGTTATTQSWTFALIAQSGADGVRTTTITASTDSGCLTADATGDRSYTVDNTAPTLTAATSPGANGFGWHNSDVTITWTASDAGSGVASGPTPQVQTQTAETGGVVKASTATDAVGNVRNASVVVKLDKTAPSITGLRNPAPNANGWNNTSVVVTFTCSDGRSGIRSCPGSTTFSTNVAGQLVDGTAVDFAGNTTSIAAGPINIDTNAPTLSGSPQGSPNAAGWYNTAVSIAWTCTDAGGSNFAIGVCDSSVIAGDGTGLTATKIVTDLAGNSSQLVTSSPAVNIDQTAPQISALSAPPPNASGWNNTGVTVTFSCADATSGIVACPSDVPLSTDGAGQAVVGTVYDNAGNSASATALVSIDTTPPTVAVSGVVDGGTYEEDGYTAGCATADALSGVASPAALASSGGPTGPVTLSCAGALDRAGNSQAGPVTVTIYVVPAAPPVTYDFSGFLAPVTGNDALNVAKAGQSVPVRFSLGGYRGMAIFAAGYPLSASYSCSTTPPWLAGGAAVTANGGLTYDAATDTYSYVWKTDRSWTGCRVLEIQFSDGSQQRAFFTFR